MIVLFTDIIFDRLWRSRSNKGQQHQYKSWAHLDLWITKKKKERKNKYSRLKKHLQVSTRFHLFITLQKISWNEHFYSPEMFWDFPYFTSMLFFALPSVLLKFERCSRSVLGAISQGHRWGYVPEKTHPSNEWTKQSRN